MQFTYVKFQASTNSWIQMFTCLQNFHKYLFSVESTHIPSADLASSADIRKGEFSNTPLLYTITEKTFQRGRETKLLIANIIPEKSKEMLELSHICLHCQLKKRGRFISIPASKHLIYFSKARIICCS